MTSGRPTKYKPEYCQKLIEHMSKGYSYETFGASIGVVPDTIYRWEKDHENFSEAKKLAKALCQQKWEGFALENITTDRGTTFNQATWVFNMKARFKWKDQSEVTQNVNLDLSKDRDERDKEIKELLGE